MKQLVHHIIITFCFILKWIKVEGLPINTMEDKIIEEGEGSRILRRTMTYYEMDDMMIMGKAGQLSEVYRWPNGRIPFSFASGYTKRQMMDIYLAMRYIEEFTCITFGYRKNDDENYIHIQNVKGKCSSFVGNIRRGAQLVALDPASRKCSKPDFPGHVLHELVHAIGFFHEHSRNDRDTYIKILYENLPKDDRTRKNYNKNQDNRLQSNTYGVPYNYGSIMHYSGRGGSINGKDTIVRKKIPRGVKPPYDGVMGQREKLSRGDVLMIQRMYQKECPGTVNEQDIPREIPDLDEWMADRQVHNAVDEPEFPIENISDEFVEITDEIPETSKPLPVATTVVPASIISRKTTNKVATITTIPTTKRPNLFNLIQLAWQNINPIKPRQ